MAVKPGGLLERSYYLVSSLIIAGVVASGFSRTIGARLLHRAPDEWIYVGVDVLILLSVGSDLIASRHLHPVYRFGNPSLLLGQTIAMYLDVSGSPQWLAIAHRLIG